MSHATLHAARLLDCTLGLRRRPVAVDLAHDEVEYAAWPATELKRGLSFCAMVRLASLGRGRKGRSAHFACPGSAEVFRFAEPAPEALAGERLASFGLYADHEVAATVQRSMARLAEPCLGVAVLPLDECTRPPAAVLLVVDAYQAMRLVQGWAYHHGPLRDLALVGNRGVCAEGVAQPLATGRPHLTPLCANTRFSARWSDGELGFGLPFAALDSLLDGLVRTIPAVEPPDRRQAIRLRCEGAGLELEVPADPPYYLR